MKRTTSEFLASLRSLEMVIAAIAVAAIAIHLVLRFGFGGGGTVFGASAQDVPLWIALACGSPLVLGLANRLVRWDFSSDLLAGISIVTSVILGEYLAGTLVVLMLSGGQALEAYAVRRASYALEALAKRMPSLAHRKVDGAMVDVPLAEVAVGDALVVFPHETCPVDGVVLEGRSTMNEAYLTGEPYLLPKAAGSEVLSGAVNGDGALTIRAEKSAVDSRYAKIMEVMRESEQRRPQLRRLGDQLGAIYTPLAMAIALAAWALSGDATRFLAVLVVATPCPLLIAIPTAIIGAVSLAARRGIIIKDPAVLEKVGTCRVAIFDKTGTLTYGQPKLTEIHPAPGFTGDEALAAVASLERYSRHPLASAMIEAADVAGLPHQEAEAVSERPGEGLRGQVGGRTIRVTSRKKLAAEAPESAAGMPPQAGGLECVALVDGRYAATFRFRDEPRAEGRSFIKHLGPRHGFDRVLMVSGDRESEVRYLAEKVGIDEVYAGQSPEQKLALVRQETAKADTVFLGDGINDAPALTAATVGIAFGQASDVTAEAAGAVILESSLERVDELLHIGRRMRTIALQSAVGGMALSLIGMGVAAAGWLPPTAGAITQEVIDVVAVLNALRAAAAPRTLTDYASKPRDGSP
ncbi:heavy metal translocating P-type ATPase [Planctomyces sp. SH-PL62]|uniref:heavy metal translocating P-type ATPase n=1 Tax=Planctomyces sp. SH-PL62 TaxID=1636152 RepID=UPI00078ED15C|nr:heavy metal translocating P-type ATPase [Planctomyces sp. SH-PL62]AMV40749.1 Zinc-transporting ATPase [Planctomyces sp. SH-PL62]